MTGTTANRSENKQIWNLIKRNGRGEETNNRKTKIRGKMRNTSRNIQQNQDTIRMKKCWATWNGLIKNKGNVDQEYKQR